MARVTLLTQNGLTTERLAFVTHGVPLAPQGISGWHTWGDTALATSLRISRFGVARRPAARSAPHRHREPAANTLRNSQFHPLIPSSVRPARREGNGAPRGPARAHGPDSPDSRLPYAAARNRGGGEIRRSSPAFIDGLNN